MKPILFNTEMVKSISDGHKTQTRRPVKPRYDRGRYARMTLFNSIECIGNRRIWWGVDQRGQPFINDPIEQPKYEVGDILWVRETYRPLADGYEYKASIEKDYRTHRWKPSIHMPFEAARIFLRVTGVRADKLQEISNSSKWQSIHDPLSIRAKDLIAEGITGILGDDFLDYVGYFKESWDSIYAKHGYPWSNNDWVWVYDFEVVSCAD